MSEFLFHLCLGFLLVWAGWLLRDQKKGNAVAKLVNCKCAHEYCDSRPDPRCVAENCTQHCASSIGCNERCLDAWAKSEAANSMASQMLSKAKVR